jgi:hypothetical protein
MALELDPQTRARFNMLLLLIGVVTLLGILMLSIVTIIWKRIRRRDEEERKRPDGPAVDPWVLSGRRLTGDAPPPGMEDLELGLDDLDDEIDEDVLDGDAAEHDVDDEEKDADDEDDEDEEDDPPFERFPLR